MIARGPHIGYINFDLEIQFSLEILDDLINGSNILELVPMCCGLNLRASIFSVQLEAI